MPFKVPQFTVCCCGCSLRTGVYIIAAINIVCFICLYLDVLRNFEQFKRSHNNSTILPYYFSVFLLIVPSLMVKTNYMLFLLPGSYIIIQEIYWLVRGDRFISRIEYFKNDLFDLSVTARLVLAFCLLYGCYKHNPSYMLGFCMMQAVFIIHYVLFALLFVLIHIMGVPSEEIFIYTISAVIQGYSAIIVYSHYRNLKEGRSILI